jgi:membrane-associated protein
MRYPLFLGFDVIGGIAWGAGLTLLGYFLGGTVPFVHDHLEVALLLIALLSVLPGILSVGRPLLQRRPKTRPREHVS